MLQIGALLDSWKNRRVFLQEGVLHHQTWTKGSAFLQPGGRHWQDWCWHLSAHICCWLLQHCVCTGLEELPAWWAVLVACRLLLSTSGKSVSCLNLLSDGTRKNVAVSVHLKITASLAERCILKVSQAKPYCMIRAAWVLQEFEAGSIEDYPVQDTFPSAGMQYNVLLEGPWPASGLLSGSQVHVEVSIGQQWAVCTCHLWETETLHWCDTDRPLLVVISTLELFWAWLVQ